MTILDGKALLQHGQLLACRHAGRIGLEAAQDLGSEAILRVAFSPVLAGVTGRYFEAGRRADPLAPARDPAVGRRFWEISASLAPAGPGGSAVG